MNGYKDKTQSISTCKIIKTQTEYTDPIGRNSINVFVEVINI